MVIFSPLSIGLVEKHLSNVEQRLDFSHSKSDGEQPFSLVDPTGIDWRFEYVMYELNFHNSLVLRRIIEV